MIWLYSLALAVVLAGFVGGINLLKSIRSAKYPQAEIAWQQPAVSYWKYETTNMISILINDMGLICLAIILVITSANSDVFAYLTKYVISLLLSLLSMFGIIIAAYSIGSSLAFHFARQWIQPVSYAISEEGLFYGGSIVSWKSFSHYEIGPDDGMISLFSSYSPSIRIWVLNPPSESFSGILAIIQKNLPPSPPIDNTTSWRHSPLTLILGIGSIAIVASLPAVWGFLHGQNWVWVYALGAFLSIQLISARIMTTFDGRGKYPAKPAMTK
jgi:hypothetical protein